MSKYIDADKLMSELVNEDWGGEISFSSVDDIVEKLMKEEADVAPVVHAHWEKIADHVFRCSLCNNHRRYASNYCPNCGAKMDEEEKNNVLD